VTNRGRRPGRIGRWRTRPIWLAVRRWCLCSVGGCQVWGFQQRS